MQAPKSKPRGFSMTPNKQKVPPFYGVGTALITPFRDGEVDLAAFRALCERQIAGGVSANSLLRRTLEEECLRRGWQFFKPDKSLCGDNAAMVGSQGYYEYLSGNTADANLNAYATMSIEKYHAK